MAKDSNDPKSVSDFIEALEPEFAGFIQKIREAILQTDPQIGEQIKWNSPSFFWLGEMKSFDPKTYARDLIVLNLRKSQALLIFPTGNKVEDSSGLLQGDYSDGRRIVLFKSVEEFNARKIDLENCILDWLSKVEKPD